MNRRQIIFALIALLVAAGIVVAVIYANSLGVSAPATVTPLPPLPPTETIQVCIIDTPGAACRYEPFVKSYRWPAA